MSDDGCWWWTWPWLRGVSGPCDSREVAISEARAAADREMKVYGIDADTPRYAVCVVWYEGKREAVTL